jgi:hypothetical protein
MSLRGAHVRRILSLSLTLVLVACGGDDDGGLMEPETPATGPANGTMTATVDGNSWTAIQIVVVRTSSVVSVAGGSSAAEALAIAWQDQGIGTYIIGGTPIATANMNDGGNVWSASGVQGSGSVTITAISATSVSGTFTFTAVIQGAGSPETRTATNGAFTVDFP